MTLKIIAIAAMDEGRVIGLKNKLPWRIPEDMQRFSELTSGHAVLMGRKTYESLPSKFRPLPNRKNIVISRSSSAVVAPGVDIWESSLGCIEACRKGELLLPSDMLWIIGGGQIYKDTLPFWDELYLTVVHSKHEGDVFFPQFEDKFRLVEDQIKEGYSFLRYCRVV